jgi:hypothetical protein
LNVLSNYDTFGWNQPNVVGKVIARSISGNKVYAINHANSREDQVSNKKRKSRGIWVAHGEITKEGLAKSKGWNCSFATKV